MDILEMINRATELFDEGVRIYEQVKGTVSDAAAALTDTTLEDAQARLQASMQRAQTAHDQLNNAIDARLGQ